MALPARYNGKCGVCGDVVHAGTPIVKVQLPVEGWAHERCGYLVDVNLRRVQEGPAEPVEARTMSEVAGYA